MPEQEDPSPTAPPHAPSGATPDRALWSGDVPTVEPAPIRAHFGLDPDVAADERSDSLWTTAFSGPPKSSVLQPGELICERYEVVRILGTGGMGSVYEVRDKELRESVALKLFHHIGEDPVALDRFRQEMVICRRLSHAAIVRTFEFGRWDGHYFYTMELLVGQDLNAVIESRYDPMRAADGVPLLQQICDGLSAAHEQGVIHRDIKPHNVFLLKGGRTVKVMDFGVAKSAELGMVPTAAGILLGTPAYMSPERLMSGESDGPAVDLWALGVLAYTLFTGTQPFPGDNLAEVVPRIISGNLLAPRLLCPSINARLEAVILRMLLKDPKKRYQSADAVRVALERVRS